MKARRYRDAEGDPLVVALSAEIVDWSPDFVPLRPGSETTRELSERWIDARRANDQPRLRFELTATERSAESLQLLLLPAVGAASAYINTGWDLEGWLTAPIWARPPRIAVLGDEELEADLRVHWSTWSNPETPDAELLVVGRGSAVELRHWTAPWVLSLDGEPRPTGENLAAAGFAGWITCATPPNLRAALLDNLASLLEQHPLDVAIAEAARGLSQRAPVTSAIKDALKLTDPATPARVLKEQAHEARPPKEQAPPPAEGPAASEPVGEDEDEDEDEDYGHGSFASAYALPFPSRRWRDVRPPRPGRFLQAQARAFEASDRAPERDVAGIDLIVRVGPHDRDWVSAPTAFPALDRPDRAHTLQVTLVAPTLLPEPQRREIELPPDGASDECAFFVEAQHGGHQARLIVQHDGRVLQTALVRIAFDGDRGTLLRRVEIRDEVAVAADLDDLDWGRTFDAALVVNHGADNEPGLAVLPRDGLPLYQPVGWDEAAQGIRGVLQLLADQGPSTDGWETEFPRTLAFLAHQGAQLHEALAVSTGLAELPTDPVIQIISARPDSWLPAEFIYDGPLPRFDGDVAICLRAMELLADDTAVGRRCDAASHAPGTVCPLGFWGLRTVFERQAHQQEFFSRRSDWSLQAEARRDRDALSAPATALFAAHRQVDVVRKSSTADVKAALTHAGVDYTHVDSWEDWTERVAADGPAMLVILGHNVERTYGERSLSLSLRALEIDVGMLEIGLVGPQHIAAMPGVHPIVLLLCCSTANAAVPYQGFAAKFRNNGAPVVIATLTDVFGRYAAPAACRAVEYLTDPTHNGARVGELMLGLRRRLFTENLPIGLTLVAYGDADWKLTTT